METKFDRFKIEWLLIKDLLPHPKVQRPYRKEWAEEIGANFDPDKFRPLDVIPAPNGGKFYVFAGQHRLGGARVALGENQRVPCHVHDVDTPLKQLAAVCLGVDDMLNWQPIDRWKLRLLAQEEVPVKIDALLTRRGIVVKKTAAKGSVRAVTALEDIYVRQGGETALDRVLRILGGAFRDDKDAYDGSLLRGVALVVYRLGDKFDDATMVTKLQRHSGPGRLIGLARDYAKATGQTLVKAMTERIMGIYNKGLQRGKLSIDWNKG